MGQDRSILPPASRIANDFGDGDRTHIPTADHDFPTYYTVDELEQTLAPLGFLRINSGTLINPELIDHIIPNGDRSYDLVLADRFDDTLTHYLRMIRTMPRPTAERERELTLRATQGDMPARNELVESNLRLVTLAWRSTRA